MEKLCSIIIPCWNGKEYIGPCLSSVYKQTHAPIEVIMVDNFSTDGSKELIKEEYPQVKLIENAENKGFAIAVNQGIREAIGEYVLVLNLDVELESDYIEAILKKMEADRLVGSATGKLLRDRSLSSNIDSTGHLMFADRISVNRGQSERDSGQYEEDAPLFGVPAAAAIYRKKMLEDIKIEGEYFDGSFNTMYEDIDLDWRALLKGWKSLYVHNAVAYHKRNVWTNRIANKLDAQRVRNRWLTRVKNETFLGFMSDLPFSFIADLGLLTADWLPSGLFLPALSGFIKLLPEALRKRKLIQEGKKVGFFYLRKSMPVTKRVLRTFAEFLAAVILIVMMFIYLPLKYSLIILTLLIIYTVASPAIARSLAAKTIKEGGK